MKNQFKIPEFISKAFAELDNQEQKQELIERYKRWADGEFTTLYKDWMEAKYNKLVKEDEEQSDFASWFSFSYKKAKNRTMRLTIRSLLDKINYEI
jgi:hypothetical protein